jgi:hypothetical protein
LISDESEEEENMGMHDRDHVNKRLKLLQEQMDTQLPHEFS